MTALPRISGRTGQVIDLNVSFYRNGILTDPFAIRRIEIYHTAVLPHNLVATLPFVLPTDQLYPAPAQFEFVPTDPGLCGTAPATPTQRLAGKFHLLYSVPQDLTVPDVFFDVWYFFSDNPCGELGTAGASGCNIDDPVYDSLLRSACHRFWLYPDQTYVDDGLQTIRFGFEPLDLKFQQPEARPLEVGLMPLPLYDYNFNLVQPLIPLIDATITVETQFRELLVNAAPMSIGLRQGSFRTNPWVLSYMLDTNKFLKGTYQYYVTLHMPDGSSRVSKRFIFTVS